MKKIILCLSVIGINFLSSPIYASNAWLTPDQQGAKLLAQGKNKEAARTFSSPHWQGVAQFKSAQFDKAVKTFQSLPKTARNSYNLGNALAHTGNYEKAIEAYNDAIKLSPNDQDAIHNKKVIEELLKKQKQDQQNKDKQKQDQQDKDKQKQDQQDKDKQKQDQQDKDKQKQDQQDKDKQKQDQQDKDKQKQDQQDKDKQKQDQQDKDKQKQDQQDKDKQKQDQQDKDKQKQNEQQNSSLKGRENNQAEMQQLKRVPDNPGGLLKQKFLRDYINRHPEQRW